MKKLLIISMIILCLTACFGDAAPPVSYSTAELAEAVKESVDFPVMVEHTGEDIEIFVGFKLGYAEEITVFQQALTVHLVEIIVVKPEAGSMDNVMRFLQQRQASLRETAALYPLQQAAIEASVVGSKGGIAYFICHENAPAAEAALIDKLS